MKMIGIDADGFLVYEGSSMWGHAVWPTPMLLGAEIVDEDQQEFKRIDTRDILSIQYVFWDEGFDPTSRVRRGRLFERCESQTQQWHVYPHPALPNDTRHANRDGVIQKQLATFRSFPFRNKLKNLGVNVPLVILGIDTQYTIWTVIDVESAISGETILYIKARKTIGALPRIRFENVPGDHRDRVKEKVDSLVEEIYRAGPESVVDAAREALTAILSAYLQDKGSVPPGKDLAKLAEELEKDGKTIGANLSKVVARLHGRRKNAEQEKRLVRRVTEYDAELAVQCVGVALLELGWE